MEFEEVKPNFYVSKGRFGWRRVYPYKINGKINWKHLLIRDWGNLFWMFFFLAIVIFGAWSYNHDMQTIQTASCLVPELYCKGYQDSIINWSQINIGVILNGRNGT